MTFSLLENLIHKKEISTLNCTPLLLPFQRIDDLIHDESIKKENLYILGLIYEYYYDVCKKLNLLYYDKLILDEEDLSVERKVQEIYIKAGLKGGIREARDRVFELELKFYIISPHFKLDTFDYGDDEIPF